MKKILICLIALTSCANASNYLDLQLRYSVDGAIPTLKFNAVDIGDGIFLGMDAPNSVFVGGFDYADDSIFITTRPTSGKITYARKFEIGESYKPYIGLSVGNNQTSGIDAGLIFKIL
jgi:hypothetical protein